MTYREKLKVYRQLLASMSKGVQLAALLSEEGREDEAEEVARGNQKLAREVAKLRRSLTADWQGSARKVLKGIRAENAKLQRRIRKVERSLDTAQDIAKAVGYLDEVVGIARKVLA
jgi:hypothetical protein